MHYFQRWITCISIVSMMLLVGLAGFTSLSKAHGGETTSRVSVASDGTEGNDDSNYPSVSADGRDIAFDSRATNLVASDTNSANDVFVHDRQTGETRRVSVASDGTQGNNSSYYPSLAADGRYIGFNSFASTLVANDGNGVSDVFVHDRQIGQTRRVSIASDGTQGNGDSYFASLSADGRYIAFHSAATNLIAKDTNSAIDVFVHDRETGQTSLASVASSGEQGNQESSYPSISADGRYVAFYSYTSNLVPNDTNGVTDIFVHDRELGQTTRVSMTSGGIQSNGNSLFPIISGDGRYVVFHSIANNLVTGDTNGNYDVFIYDRQTEQTSRISVASGGTEGNNASYAPTISADGRYIAFYSLANNLVISDGNSFPDVFLHDRHIGQTMLISVASDGTQGNGLSDANAISGDGRYIAFSSQSTNLVGNDTNGIQDVFIRDRGAQPTSTPTLTPITTFTATPTPTQTEIPATLTATPTVIVPTLTPTSTGAPPSPTFTPTGVAPSFTPSPTTLPPTFTLTSTTIVSPSTPTATGTATGGDVYIPLVLQQSAFATPPPVTPTPGITPLPTCEVVDHEPNNVFLEADNHLPLCAGGAVTGSVAPTTDINDIYRITVASAGTIAIALTNIPAGADYDLYLYDARGGTGQIAVSNTAGSANEEIRTSLPDGRYYVRVVSLQYAGVNTYQLRWIRE